MNKAGTSTTGVHRMIARSPNSHRAPQRSLRNQCTCAVALLAGAILVAPAVGGAASFYPLGTLGGGTSKTIVEGMTEDGSKLVGRINGGGSNPAGPIVYGERTLVLEMGQSEANGTTADNSGIDRVASLDGLTHYTVGHSETALGSRIWLETYDVASNTATATTTLPVHPASNYDMEARGVGRNQRVILQSTTGVPPSTTTAYSYDSTSTLFTALPMQLVHDIDAAGRRIVGTTLANGAGEKEAVLWDETYGTTLLGTLAGGTFSEGLGVSASGRIIVGGSESIDVQQGQREPFRWHPDLGMRPLLPIQDYGRRGVALAASDSNSVVGFAYKTAGPAPLERAFIWTPMTGRIDLQNYLVNYHGVGDTLAGWTLTKATEISADGKIIAGEGINPGGQAEAWIIDLDGAQRAEVRMRSVDPDGSPPIWDFYLQCGDVAIEELYFGAIMPTTFGVGDPIDFADCTDDSIDTASLYCTGSSSLGPNVLPGSSFFRIPYIETSTLPEFRDDAIYFHFVGQGGSQNNTLCEPGDSEVTLGSLNLMNVGTPALTRSALDGSHGISPAGPLLDEDVSLVHQPLSPETLIRIQPSLDDVDGSRWIVILESDVVIHSFSFGMVLPPSAVGGSVTFGGCDTEPAMPNGFNERLCPANADLGQNVDPAGSRTAGPAAAFLGSGLRTDTLYAYIEGNLSGPTAFPAINVAGKPTPLGILDFGGPPPPDFAFTLSVNFDLVTDLPLHYPDFGVWIDLNGLDFTALSTHAGSIVGPLPGADSDGDHLEDSVDLCPYVPSPNFPGTLDDSGTLEQFQAGTLLIAADWKEGIGDECQCGNSSNSGFVQIGDLTALQNALLDPGSAGEFAVPFKCNSVGPVDNGEIDLATGLTPDCNINDLYALLKAHNASGPLIPEPGTYPSPGAFVSCPDMYAPPSSLP